MKNNLGTFVYCSNCQNVSDNCCNHFDQLDNPLVTDLELETINKVTDESNIFLKATKNLHQIRTINNKCLFYKNKKCDIYENRPIDCRLFPFDIINKDDKYYIIIYDNPCAKFNSKKEFILENIGNIEKLAKDLYPYLKEYTSNKVNIKNRKMKYTIIKEI